MAPVTRLTALVPGAVCAAALGRDWPDSVDGRVRCIDEGVRALGLAFCCAPWPVQAEDRVLKAELGEPSGPGSDLPEAPAEDVAAGTDASRDRLTSPRSNSPAHSDADAVAAGLARVPAAAPVLGLVSGPLTWSIRAASGPALPDAVDAASDLAAARVRALAGCGVERVVVVESVDAGCVADVTLADEAHRPVRRTAEHLRIELVLVASGLDDVESLGYDRWAAEQGCSPGMGFLPSDAFASLPGLQRCLDRCRIAPDAEEVISAPLEGRVSPDLLRHAARTLAAG